MPGNDQPSSRLLLIEDDPSDVSAARQILRGYQIDISSTVADAIDVMRRTRYDLVLVGLKIGPDQGAGAAGRVSRAAEAADTPVVVWTSISDELLEVIRRDLIADTGVIHVLSKTLPEETFLRLLDETILRSRRAIVTGHTAVLHGVEQLGAAIVESNDSLAEKIRSRDDKIDGLEKKIDRLVVIADAKALNIWREWWNSLDAVQRTHITRSIMALSLVGSGAGILLLGWLASKMGPEFFALLSQHMQP